MPRRGGGRLVIGVLTVGMAAGMATACTEEPGGTVDGSCTAARSTVSSLQVSDGTVRWRRQLAHPREVAPEVASGLVALRGCGVVVLDSRTGRRQPRGADAAAEADVVGIAGRYLVSARDGDVRAHPVRGRGGFQASSQPPYEQVAVADDLLLAADGDELVAWQVSAAVDEGWRTTLPTLARATFGTTGDLLVVRADDGSVYGLAAADGTVRWRAVPSGALGYGVPVAVTPSVVVVPVGLSESHTVAALDVGTGVEVWRAVLDTGAPVGGRWAAADGVLAAPAPRGTAGVDLGTGRVVWRSDADPAGAVGVGGTLVLADPQAAVGVDPRSGRELWRTPTEHRPYLAADQPAGAVVVLDSPPVPHVMNDCC